MRTITQKHARLKKVAQAYELIEKKRQTELALCHDKIRLQKEALRKIVAKKTDFIQHLAQDARPRVAQVLQNYEYLDVLEEEIRVRSGELADLKKDAEKRKQALLQVRTKKKSLEKICEQVAMELQTEEQKREQTEIDRVAERAYTRASR